ncbi:hypothetical protein OHJ21_25170 [Virgibacillus sp. LDC1]|nr:hypothetical protein [Virgibacillus sp. LDC1]
MSEILLEDDDEDKYPGLLHIGEQGCSYETGEYRSKGIYVDLDS